jgi:hypothetical protein
MLLISVACLIGVVFGLHYKFVVLVPLTLAAGLAYSFAGALHGQTIPAIAYGIMLLAFALQGGYMIGLTGRDFLGQIFSRFMAIPSKRG